MDYYPENEKSQSRPFYVEFNRGNRKGEFTLFRRQWMSSEEDLEKLKKETTPDNFFWIEVSNEVHPWNLFTGGYGPDGCVPDQKWVCWMVDALNDKHQRTLAQKKADEEMDRITAIQSEALAKTIDDEILAKIISDKLNGEES